jgi:hypothetical protein
MRFGKAGAVKSVLILLVALAVSGVAAGANSDVSHKVGWHESFSLNGKPFMAFEVTSINVSSTRWSAEVTVRNKSSFSLTVPARLFQLAIYNAVRPANCHAYTALRGNTPVPPPPAVLKPGSTWRTTFGGPHGRPANEPGWARVVFAYFRGGPDAVMRQDRFGWITDHALSLTTGRSVRATLPC